MIAPPLFTGMFPPVGETITETVAGEATSGITALFHTATLKRTGGAGKETNIGKKTITGA
jgi:hypothetical protein